MMQEEKNIASGRRHFTIKTLFGRRYEYLGQFFIRSRRLVSRNFPRSAQLDSRDAHGKMTLADLNEYATQRGLPPVPTKGKRT